jgi:hypothetical protein
LGIRFYLYCILRITCKEIIQTRKETNHSYSSKYNQYGKQSTHKELMKHESQGAVGA